MSISTCGNVKINSLMGIECFEQSFEGRERERKRSNGWWERVVVDGTKEDCMDFVQENRIVMGL